MKKEKDKKIFVIILGILLILMLIFSSISNKDDSISASETDEVTDEIIVLENESLYLEALDDDSYYIGGEGILCSEDMTALLNNNRILSTDIINMVIGDGITELEYNTINNYIYLETLKIGSGTTKIRNGAVKNCQKLKFVYVPSSLEKVGMDFLNGCSESVILVTDTSVESLNQILDNNGFKILPNVYDYDSLVNFVTNYGIPYASYSCDNDLMTTYPEGGKNPIVLPPGYTQYGPYVHIDAGEYRVVINGSNLDKVSNENIYINNESEMIPERTAADISNDCIVYDMSFNNEMWNVEFCVDNKTENETIEISSIEMYICGIEIPDAIRYWWL